MSMVGSYTSCLLRITRAVLAGALFSSLLWMTAAKAESLSIALPGERAFPESITSARDGTLFVGRLGEGGVVRVNPRTGAAALFVAPGAADSRSITGVFADEASGTLCAGLDGIAFGGDGALYVTTYAAGGFFRIAIEKGRALGLPDGLRPCVPGSGRQPRSHPSRVHRLGERRPDATLLRSRQQSVAVGFSRVFRMSFQIRKLSTAPVQSMITGLGVRCVPPHRDPRLRGGKQDEADCNI